MFNWDITDVLLTILAGCLVVVLIGTIGTIISINCNHSELYYYNWIPGGHYGYLEGKIIKTIERTNNEGTKYKICIVKGTDSKIIGIREENLFLIK